MSDEEESMSEGFSASEDEWKPSKETRGGESSDDDDSDFEESSPIAAISASSGGGGRKRGEREPKARSAAKQGTSKKRPGLSLRAKLYNKYRPLPKTCSPPSSEGKNSPSASTSRTNSKNAKTPNESSRKRNDNEDDGSSSDGSIDNYLVDPNQIDFESSLFNLDKANECKPSVSPVPNFDCNAGLGNLSDSESDADENNDSGNFHKTEDTKAFDFSDLLQNAKSLERVKESLAKHAAEEAAAMKAGTPSKKSLGSQIDTMDVYSILALGEKQHRSHNDGEDEEDDDDEEEEDVKSKGSSRDRHGKEPSKLSKTKSTRVKRHTKTRPASTVVAGGETDDSDFEEVADSSQYADTSTTASSDISHSGNLEIHIELPGRQQKDKKTRTQQDLEMALKRKFNRDMRERQLLMHKASLLCHFGRTYRYNRLLNDTILMQKSLKLLPSKNAYPPERGTEIKYYQSLVTWFKSTIQLNSQNLYPDKKAIKKKAMAHRQLLMQIENKQARCKQDYIFIFIILLRGMGLQCRLINNMQPLPLKPQQSDLISMKVKKEDDKDEGKRATVKTTGDEKKTTTTSKHVEKPGTSSKIKAVKEETVKRDNKHNESKEKPNRSKSAVEKLTKSVKTADKIKDSQEDKKELLNKSAASKEEAIPNTKTSSTSKKATDKPNLNKLTVPKAAVKIEKATINVQKDTSTDEEKHLENLDNISKDTSAAKPKISRMRSKSCEPTHADSNKSSSTQVVKSERKARAKNPVTKGKTRGKSTDTLSLVQTSNEKQPEVTVKQEHNSANNEELENSQKENSPKPKKANLARLKRNNVADDPDKPPKKKLVIESGTPLIPTVVIKGGKEIVNDTPSTEDPPTTSTRTRATRSRSKSPQIHISTAFLQTKQYREKFPGIIQQNTNVKNRQDRGKSPSEKVKISADFLSHADRKTTNKRVLRSSQKPNESETVEAQKSTVHLQIPQMDGAHDDNTQTQGSRNKKSTRKKKLTSQTNVSHDSDEDFEPSPIKKPKIAPTVAKKDRRVLSTDEESSPDRQRKPTAGDMWVEVWSDVEEQWICLDLFKGKIHCVDTIRKSASPNMAYIFAFQNDLSIKDVTARYNPHWTNVVRKSRVEKSWLDTALQKYLGHRTKRDIKEDQELRRIHEEKPLPTSISDYKNHPFYALERHLLKFEAIYPPTAPTLGFIRGEAVYSRDCVHTLHSREIWLKQARVVKLGEKPYKIVKARPKWDRITQTVIKDQPLEIFGYWQTEEYDPPTAENGIVPRNAYGNVELFKPTMLPKKCVHMRLPGLNRVCKKLGIDCANAVVGFDFHQGACHPTYDGFVICEEFQDQVTAAWYQEQEEQERKEQEKYEARVYGNWKKLIRGLLIRERLKLKYGL